MGCPDRDLIKRCAGQGIVVLRVGRDEGHAASPVSGHGAAAKRKRASMCWQLRQTATLDAPAAVSCISLQPSEGSGISELGGVSKSAVESSLKVPW